ncbi:MAG: hypothetical protein AAF810_26875 [Cyanobacteria bacterium P01_D01_bin.36]
MKRFILSAFSVLLATAAIAPVAQAAPTLSSDFNLQTLRLQEFDARNKSEDASQSYDYDYPQGATQTWTEDAAAEQDSSPAAEPTAWEAPEAEAEASEPALSLTARRQQALDERE